MRSFAQRLTLRFAALVTATTAAVLAVGGWLLNRQIIASAEFLHEVEFKELHGIIGNDSSIASAEIARRIAHDADSDAALYFIQIHSDRGVIVFRSANLGENFLPDLSGRELHWTFDLAGVGPVRISEFHDGPWHFQIASALAPLHRVLRDYVEVSAILVIGVGVLSVALGCAFARVTLRPIRAIEATANRIRSDNLSERIPVPSGRDELAALSQLLNQMFDRIEVAFAQVRRFT
ncbi:MAG TPA: HAMP domain-containing protein, partial [Opitutaceae bacterium]